MPFCRTCSAAVVLLTSLSLFAQPATPFYHLSGRSAPSLRHALFAPDHDVLLCTAANPHGSSVDLPPALFNPHELSICAWVVLKAQKQHDYRQVVFKSRRNDSPQRVDFKFGFWGAVPEFAYIHEDGKWHGIMRNGNDLAIAPNRRVPLADCPRLREDHWEHVAAVFNHGHIALYINGECRLEGRTPHDALLIQDTLMRIGCGEASGGANAFVLNGLLDDLRLYPQALDSAQIKQLVADSKGKYSAGKIRFQDPSEQFKAEFDPTFARKLAIVKAYEANPPPPSVSAQSPSMSIVRQHGVPMAARDGVVESMMCLMPQCSTDNHGVTMACRDFAAAGVDTVSDIFFPWMKWGDNCSGWWLAPGEYDFARIEDRLRAMTAGNPNARIIVRIKMNVPNWWLERYPEELSVNERGARSQQPAMSSERWLNDACGMLTDVVRHLEQSPLAKHIIGYLPAGGGTSEWFWWNYEKGLQDYSPANTAVFRRWLMGKYGTDDALQRAWRNPAVTLANATVPSPDLRNASEDGVFRDVRATQAVTDYRLFMSDVTSAAIGRAVRAVRAGLTTRKLVGTFYGYAHYLAGNTWQRLDNLGFQNLHKVLADPELDFLCAPTAYDRRRGGQEGDFIVAPTASLQLHNKLYWDEADIRTHLADGNESHKATSPDETAAILWRSFGHSLTKGTYLWWFLLSGNASFHTERIMNDVSAMARLDRELIDQPRRSVADIAVFSDELSLHYLNSTQPRLRNYSRDAFTELARLGAPSDCYLLDDIAHPALPRYKLYIFLNAFYITPERRQAIHDRLARDGATALWFYAPGYLSPTGNDCQTMAELTGISFTRQELGQDASVDWLDAAGGWPGDPLRQLKRCPALTPAFAVNDAAATPLARLAGTGAVVAASKELPWGRSVYCLVPPSAEFLRALCDLLAIHVYSRSNDVFQANARFVMLHSRDDAPKSITLPKPRGWRNLIDGTVHPPTASISFPLPHGQTALFELLPPEDAQP
ncbi:LamG-like jellyroll fold domain-containing protein [Oligosphaera ethanolica]|uniref:LamG-like jellyroll fold domain-containing protein n=1 Tax=Oligosphaera ethanolica TaxID=760260 RepID=A0AAE3VJK3_9BACT|nr:LamG-like jellyroll fold domain-containing protein [Oligosphaera ethanolica]MDQ0291605.1 hypothetical protein [Oligosphaera ethanolica]